MLTLYNYKNLRLTDLLFIISIIAIGLGFNEIAIIFFIYTFITHKEYIIPKNIVIILSLTLLSGIAISILSFNFSDYNSQFDRAIFLRNRFFIIRIIYAFSVALYMSNKSIFQILYLVYIIAILNVITGFLQLFLELGYDNFQRINMLGLESSSMAMFYVFSVPLLLFFSEYETSCKNSVWLFIILGLLIISKAQILVVLIWIILFLFKTKRKIFIVPLIIILGYLLMPYWLKLEQINALYKFFSISLTQGLPGLNESNGIFTSFTFRLSGALTALHLFSKNIAGVGFGFFYPLYIDYMNTSDLGKILSGSEIKGVLLYGNYATPKSSFLELLVSCGLFFLIPFYSIVRSLIKKNVPFLIKLSFISLVLVSFMVEIAPFLTYLIIILVIYSKREEIEPL